MSHRTPLALLAAIACTATLVGCLTPMSKAPTVPTGEGTISLNVGGPSEATKLRFKVQLPETLLSDGGTKLAKYGLAALSNEQPCVGAQVSILDYRQMQVPNTGTGKTAADGRVRIQPLPSNRVWLAKASFGGVTAATLVVPVAKKELEVTIGLASTIATAGVMPQFTQANKTYMMGYLDISKFGDLVEAVNAALDNDTSIRLSAKLSDLTTPFDSLRRKSDAVAKAYDAIVSDLKQKEALRLSGRESEIKPPSSSVDQDQDADPTDSEETATDSADTATDTVAVEPVVGTLSEVAGVTLRATSPVQMAATAGMVVVPDGDRLLVVNGTSVQTIDAAKLHVAFSDAYALAQSGTKIYTVAKINGAFNLVAIDMLTQTPDSPKPLTGQAVKSITSLQQLQVGTFLGVDPANHTLVKIKTDGSVSLLAGTPGQVGMTTGQKPAGGYALNGPSAATANGQTLYIADANNQRILKFDKTAETLEEAAGFSHTAGLKSGGVQDARFNYPKGLWWSSGASGLLVASTNGHAIQRVDFANDKVASFANEATKGKNGADLVKSPRAVAEVGNVVYIIANDSADATVSKLYKFTSP